MQTASPSLPRVLNTDPPVTLPPGIILPPLHERMMGWVGRVWFRETSIPLYHEADFQPLWRSHKRQFMERGYTIRKDDGKWSIQQWLAGQPGAYTLTEKGADLLHAASAPRQPMLDLPAVPLAPLILTPLPNGLEDKLYEYQRDPARQLFRALTNGKHEWGYPGAWDCSGLGTGKTFQALAAALATGLEVGVICPKAVIGTPPRYGPGSGTGWTGAFAHFGQVPKFIMNYEGLRTGKKEWVKKTGNSARPFEWLLDPQDTILIWDEAHLCFPGGTMIATEHGAFSIRQIVEHRLKIRVSTVDLSNGRITLRNVTGHFKNPASQLVRVTHEHGAFTCTATHKVWTREGWNQAERLERGSELRVLRNYFRPRREESGEAVLQQGLLQENHDGAGAGGTPSALAVAGIGGARGSSDNDAAGVSGVRQGVQTARAPELSLQQPMRGCLSDETAGPPGGFCKFNQSRQEGGARRGVSAGREVAHDGERCKDGEITSGPDVSGEGWERATHGAAEACRRSDRPSDGVPDRDSRQGSGAVSQPADEILCGPRGPGSEAGHRDRREDAPPKEVALSGQAEDGDTYISRVVRVEVLESGSGRGPSGGSGDDYLYDLEVEGTHCYFADGVLVHNCKNASKNRSMAFAAIRQGFPCLFLSGTMADRPTNLGATGVAVGLHDGTRASYEQFLLGHGCYKVGYTFEFNKSKAAVPLTRIHRKVFPQRGARIRVEDLGDRFPETQILCEGVETDETAKITAAFDAAADTIRKKRDQGAAEADLQNASSIAYMEAWHASERAKIPAMLALVEREKEEGRSVVLFVNFTDVREKLMDKLSTRCAVFGGQPQHMRDTAISDFQNDKSRVIIVITAAGGVGISLHDVRGEYPRTAIINPTNNAVNLGQALGRVHRAGGKSRSRQIVIFAAGTIEESIINSTRRKLNRIDSLNDGDLTPEDKF